MDLTRCQRGGPDAPVDGGLYYLLHAHASLSWAVSQLRGVATAATTAVVTVWRPAEFRRCWLPPASPLPPQQCSPPLWPPSSTAASLHHRCLPPTTVPYSPTAASPRHCCPPLPLISPPSVAAAIVAQPHRPALSPHNSATFPRCCCLPPLLLCPLFSVIPPPSPLQP